MDLDLAGKNALITGGSRGLGRESALSLSMEGVNVAICARTEETLQQTVNEVKNNGVDCIGIVSDVSKLDEVPSLHKEAVSKLGPIDILVNNAGGSRSREDITGTDLEDFRVTFDLNLFGGYELMKLVIPHMKRSSWGRIINIASIWGREYGGNISYMSAKAALIAATKHSAVSLAKHGILVNSIAPGSIYIDGGTWNKFVDSNTEEIVDNFISSNLPLGKWGWPEPVGATVAFLASEQAALIVGACINIDGGQSHNLF